MCIKFVPLYILIYVGTFGIESNILCLLRFAHFFASPLLLESSLDREIEAVDSGKSVGECTVLYPSEIEAVDSGKSVGKCTVLYPSEIEAVDSGKSIDIQYYTLVK